MSIDLVTKFLEVVDAVYQRESLTARLDAQTQPLDFAGANAVKVLKVGSIGLGNYSRAAGYPAGQVTANWETMTLATERGRAFTLDRMDSEETLGLVMGTLIRDWMATYVAPELDAYRFAKMATGAGNYVAAPAALTYSTILAAIDAAVAALNEDNVPEAGRLLFISQSCHAALQQAITRTLQTQTGVERRVFEFDGMEVIPVPQARFYTAIDLDPGAQPDEGGYAKGATAHDLNFLIVHPSAVLQPVKLNTLKYFAPETNQISDGHLWQYRLYHDCFIYDNKANGVYRHDKNS